MNIAEDLHTDLLISLTGTSVTNTVNIDDASFALTATEVDVYLDGIINTLEGDVVVISEEAKVPIMTSDITAAGDIGISGQKGVVVLAEQETNTTDSNKKGV